MGKFSLLRLLKSTISILRILYYLKKLFFWNFFFNKAKIREYGIAERSLTLIGLIIIFSIAFFLFIYYKVRIPKESDPLQQEIMNAKARIALGVFIGGYGINQYMFYLTKLSLYIGIIFVIFGIAQIVAGTNRFRHYRKEWKKRLEKTSNV